MLMEIAKGLSITFRELFKKPVTIQYPEVKRPGAPSVFGGRHELRRYADGLERCIGCALCAAHVPPLQSTWRRARTPTPALLTG